jgi:seryl-tRNA synthetase
MLDRALIRENLDLVEERLKTKSFQLDREEFLGLDQEERSVRQEWEELRALRNSTSEEIAELKKQGQAADQKIKQMKQVSAGIKKLDERFKTLNTRMGELLALIPNLPHDSVPVGLLRGWSVAGTSSHELHAACPHP